MTIRCLFFFLLTFHYYFISHLGAQETSGTILYSYFHETDIDAVIAHMERDNPAMMAQHGPAMRRSMEMNNRLRFELQFDGRRAVFAPVHGITFDDPDDKFAYSSALITATEAREAHYVDHAERLRLAQGKLESSAVNIIVPYRQYEWTLTGAEKCVEGRTLFEATTQRTALGSNGEEYEIPVHAWYAPDLPVPYGPSGFDGLPGLILELRIGKKQIMGFRATEILFSTDSPKRAKQIKKPRAVAEITESEYYQRVFDIQRKRGH